MSINKKIVEWYWAYYEQLYIFHKQDYYWIQCARSKWPIGEEMEEFDLFLNQYGLKRGKIGKYLASKERDNQLQFLTICHKHFQQDLGKRDFNTAQIRWNNTIKDLKKLQIGVDIKSATLKLYWFYHPEELPMYDSLALKALRQLFKRQKAEQNNFLEYFFKFYQSIEAELLETHQFFNQKYIYLPRVVDKYLWLMGQGEEKRTAIIKRFESAIDFIPLK